MPKRTDIHKILVIGSGPIVIGQAAEFDYSGTQACLALREEGYEVVLINSNPATIMNLLILNMLQELSAMKDLMQFYRHSAVKPASTLQFSLLKKVYLKNVMLKYSVLILTLLKERRTESFSKSFVKASANRFFRVRLQKILKTDLKLQEK